MISLSILWCCEDRIPEALGDIVDLGHSVTVYTPNSIESSEYSDLNIHKTNSLDDLKKYDLIISDSTDILINRIMNKDSEIRDKCFLIQITLGDEFHKKDSVLQRSCIAIIQISSQKIVSQVLIDEDVFQRGSHELIIDFIVARSRQEKLNYLSREDVFDEQWSIDKKAFNQYFPAFYKKVFRSDFLYTVKTPLIVPIPFVMVAISEAEVDQVLSLETVQLALPGQQIEWGKKEVFFSQAFLIVETIQSKVILKLCSAYKCIYVNLLNWFKEFVKSGNLLTPAEREEIVNLQTSNQSPYEYISIIQAFSKIVKKKGNNTAIIFDNESISYQELFARIQNIAYRLKSHVGCLKGKTIAIYMNKSIDLVAYLFAVLMNGARYVPLDPTYPKERIYGIIHESKPVLIVCDQALENEINKALEHTFLIVEKDVSISEIDRDFVDQSTPDDDAYIIFTSGSTGKPKGVVITQKNLLALVNAEAKTCQLTDLDVILSIASIGFDAFGWDVYGALLTGSTLVLSPEGVQLDPDTLSDLIEQHNVTFATFTPSVLALLEVPKKTTIKTLIVMGDKPSRDLMEKWSGVTRVMNGYGPTETTIAASLGYYSSKVSAQCIGYPLSNYRFYVVDESFNLLPKGVTGELCIGGDGVGEGYFNQETLTSEKFIRVDLVGNGLEERVYRTGDMVFQNQDNSFEFIGRNDYQVKIRGVRIEPQEIENILCQYDGIKEAVVVVSGDEDKCLIAYITLKSNIDIEALKTKLSLSVHPAAMPRHIVIIDKFELTPNGKINRNKLPDIDTTENNDQKLPPINDVEYSVLKMFQTVLNSENIGTQENFFLIGGHSLTAAQVIGEINKKFSIKLKYKDFFENATVKKVSTLIASFEKDNTPLIIRQSERVGPLTFSQDRLWYLYQLNPEDKSYNLPLAYTFNGVINLGRLESALKYVFEKHETFRTIFIQTTQGVTQKVTEIFPEIVSLQISSDELDSKLTELCKIPFVLESIPPVRVYFITCKDKLILFFVKHNIITDAWSEGVIIRDIIHAYNNPELLSFSDVNSNSIPQSLDVGFFQKTNLTKASLCKDLDYWKEKLQNPQLLDFSTHMRPSVLSTEGKRVHFKFNIIAWEYLKRLAQQHETTSFVALVTAFKIFLSKYADQNDILIGTAHSGREHGINENTTGFFVNTIPLRTVLEQQKDFLYNLTKVNQTCMDAFSHQNVPFEWIVEHSKAERFLNRNPLFQIMMVLQNADETALPNMGDGVEIAPYKVDPESAMFDMVWNFKEDDGLSVDVDYNVELFMHCEVESFLRAFDVLLRELQHKEFQTISDLSLHTSQDKTEVIQNASGHPKKFDKEDNVLRRIELAADRYKENTAVSCSGLDFSYAKLWGEADRICAYIQAKTKNSSKIRVGVSLERSERVVTAILGIIMAGGCYVPLDPAYPLDRLSFIINDAALDLIIFDSNTPIDIGVKYVDVIDHNYRKRDISIHHDDIAYIMYTSGTTGKPKGVVITHLNLLNVCDYFIHRLGLNAQSTWYSLTTISFDIFGIELFCPLMSGGRIIMSSQDVYRNPVKIVNDVNEKKPNVLQATPTMWSAIADHINVPGLHVLCGGESMSYSLLSKLKRISEKVYNVYGPTETTIWSTIQDLTHEDEVSIGFPIQNTICFTLSEDKKLCPINGVGDLYIGGMGVSKGYVDRPELTSKVFCDVEVGEQKYRLYKTGDKAILRSDGKIYCLGRADNQIKLRGNRIELEEIENVINSHTNVLMSACRLWGEGANAYIAAYVVWSPQRDFNVEELKDLITNKLPSIMHPTYIEQIDNLPKTDNGKIDRKNLPEPKSIGIATSDQGYVAPADSFESKVQDIWQKVISTKRISVVDNFFMVGGNSLHIPLIIMNLQDAFNIELTIREFILNSTVREISSFIQSRILQGSNYYDSGRREL